MSNETVLAAIIGAVATIGGAIIAAMLTRRRIEGTSTLAEGRARNYRFDVFVSAPLAAFTDDDAIAADHDRVAPVVATLEDQLSMAVYWAGRNIRKRSDFEAPDLSAKKDVEALLASRYFLLLYPHKIASSVLFEAGIALHQCLTSVYFVRDQHDLPFLMTQASQAFVNVRIYEGTLPDGLVNLLKRHGAQFFHPRRGSGEEVS